MFLKTIIEVKCLDIKYAENKVVTKPMDNVTANPFTGPEPNINKIKSFIVPKQTGINYKAGIWHFPLISTKNMNFLIIDRKGKGNNLVIYKFKKDKIVLKK